MVTTEEDDKIKIGEKIFEIFSMFCFATPPINDLTMKDTRTQRVLSHFLGYESPGSLHALLLDEGLINDGEEDNLFEAVPGTVSKDAGNETVNIAKG